MNRLQKLKMLNEMNKADLVEFCLYQDSIITLSMKQTDKVIKLLEDAVKK